MQQFSEGENLEEGPSAYETDKAFQIKQSSLGPGSHSVSSKFIPKEG